MKDSCNIRVYNRGFELLGECSTASSVRFERVWNDKGTFEIHVCPNEQTDGRVAEHIATVGNIIVINYDWRKSGVVTGVSKTSANGEDFAAYGETGNGFAYRRVIVPPGDPSQMGYDRIGGAAETVIKHYVNAHMSPVADADANRRLPRFVVAPDLGRGKVFNWQARFSNLGEELKNIGLFADVGFAVRVDLNDKTWIFDVVPGVDRSVNQSDASPVTFRLDYMNIDSLVYTEDFGNFRNAGYACGAGENENRLKQLIYASGTPVSGYDRREVFIDCGNADITELTYYGAQKLAEYKAVLSLQVNPLQNTFVFDKDYFLGDLATVLAERQGIRADVRVREVTEVWERQTGYTVSMTLGDERNTPFDILRRRQEVR